MTVAEIGAVAGPADVIDLRWTFSYHALVRMEEMEVTRASVLATADSPEISYGTGSPKYPGAVTHIRGNIAVGLDPVKRVIITVLWHGIDYDRPAHVPGEHRR